MTILRENLIAALAVAIEARRDYERERHGERFESTMVAGWKEVLQALERREPVEIRE
jgi:hypothetical protein